MTPAEQQAADELGALFPQPKTITVAGALIDLPPATIRSGVAVINKWFALLALCTGDETEPLIIEDHPDEATAILVLMLGAAREQWLSQLHAFDKYEIILAWLESNRDFFVRLREMNRRGAAISRELFTVALGDGPTLSSASTITDTSTPADSPRPPSISTSKQSPARKSANGATA